MRSTVAAGVWNRAPMPQSVARSLKFRSRRSGATVLAIRRGEDVIPNPDPVWELREEDVVLLVGTPPQLAVAGKLFLPTPS